MSSVPLHPTETKQLTLAFTTLTFPFIHLVPILNNIIINHNTGDKLEGDETCSQLENKKKKLKRKRQKK